MKLNEVLKEKTIFGNSSYRRIIGNEFKDTCITVNGDLDLSNHDIESLKDLPCVIDVVKGSFFVGDNNITSFEGCPKTCGNIIIRNNKIKSFEHCPSLVNGLFDIRNNKLTSLCGIHKYLTKCKLLDISNNDKINEGGIGLILIENLKEITYYGLSISGNYAIDIISKYLGQGKAGLLTCQEELEEAGLERFAKL